MKFLALILCLVAGSLEAAEGTYRYVCSCGARCPCEGRSSGGVKPCTCRQSGRVAVFVPSRQSQVEVIVPPAPVVVVPEAPEPMAAVKVEVNQVAAARQPVRRTTSVLVRPLQGIRYGAGGCANGSCNARGRFLRRR